MKKRPYAAHCQPWVVALRTAPGASLCADDECGLSGGYAHVGPCEPCACPQCHAVEECPDTRLDICPLCVGHGYLACRACKGDGTIAP